MKFKINLKISQDYYTFCQCSTLILLFYFFSHSMRLIGLWFWRHYSTVASTVAARPLPPFRSTLDVKCVYCFTFSSVFVLFDKAMGDMGEPWKTWEPWETWKTWKTWEPWETWGRHERSNCVISGKFSPWSGNHSDPGFRGTRTPYKYLFEIEVGSSKFMKHSWIYWGFISDAFAVILVLRLLDFLNTVRWCWNFCWRIDWVIGTRKNFRIFRCNCFEQIFHWGRWNFFSSGMRDLSAQTLLLLTPFAPGYVIDTGE